MTPEEKEVLENVQAEIKALRKDVKELSVLIREQSEFDRIRNKVMSMNAMYWVNIYWAHPSEKYYRRVKNALTRHLKQNDMTVMELYDKADQIPGISLVYSRKIRKSIDELIRQDEF